jgi:hypothetical protein
VAENNEAANRSQAELAAQGNDKIIGEKILARGGKYGNIN